MTSIICTKDNCIHNEFKNCMRRAVIMEYTEAEGHEYVYCTDYLEKEVIYIDRNYEYVKPKW
jgi:hypothetical protein